MKNIYDYDFNSSCKKLILSIYVKIYIIMIILIFYYIILLCYFYESIYILMT